MPSLDHDVIVVGAGPAGSHAARLLAEAGHDVALMDENDAPREKIVCTGIVGREAYERLSLPEQPVVDRVDRALFLSPSGVRVPYEPARPMAYVVDRREFDHALALRATRAGARLLRGHAARGVGRGEDGVAVSAHVDGGSRRLTARALVVATGHQRWLHEEAGLGVPADYVHGVHADLPFEGLDATELYFGDDVAPGFFAWAVPFGGDTARLGVLSPQGSRRHFRRFLRRPAIRERLGFSPDDEDRIRAHLRSRAIVQGPVEPSHAHRVVAVGEAAGQVKTTTAGGIYYGLIGAGLAAEVLDGALEEDRLGADELSVYEARWRGELEAEIEAGLELQRLGAELEDEEIDALFEALNDGLAAAVRQVVEFDWHRTALRTLFGRRKVWRALLDRSVPLPLAG